jgi:hypothetical protein
MERLRGANEDRAIPEGAIFQKEREEKESSRESETRLTWHSGNWMTRMEPRKLLQRNETADDHRKRGATRRY